MDDQHVTQDQLADTLGVTQPTISGWLTGRWPIPPARLIPLERALRVPAGTFTKILGLIPADSRPVRSVPEAIEADLALSADQREMLVAAYRAAVRRSRS